MGKLVNNNEIFVVFFTHFMNRSAKNVVYSA